MFFFSFKIATAVVGPGGLAISRPVATAIAGIDPDEINNLGIPLKKVKQTSSATLFNFELANKIKKGYGVGNDEGREGNEHEEEVEYSGPTHSQKPPETSDASIALALPEQVAQVGAMLQPDLDPYKLIPSQFHGTFNIKAPYEMTASRVNTFNSQDSRDEIVAEEKSAAESNFQPESIQLGRISPGAPWVFLPYSFYPPYHQIQYTNNYK